MVEVKTSELIGAALDWAVAKADGDCPVLWDMCCGNGVFSGNPNEPPVCCCNPIVEVALDQSRWSPSTDWSQAGPLIEKHGVELAPPTSEGDWWGAAVWKARARFLLDGETPLIAACRAIVAAKLGDTVQVPAELLTNG